MWWLGQNRGAWQLVSSNSDGGIYGFLTRAWTSSTMSISAGYVCTVDQGKDEMEGDSFAGIGSPGSLYRLF